MGRAHHRAHREHTMNNITTIVDAYLESLNEQDAGKRKQLVERAWAANGSFVDPLIQVAGHDQLANIAVMVATQYPGHAFRRASGIDSHNGLVRFGWEFVGPDGAIVLAGLDVGELAADGRLQRIAGFFGALPERA